MDRQIDFLALKNAPTVSAMSETAGSDNESRSPQDKNSAGGRRFAVVQCEGFRCMAYSDDGKWRDFQTGKELLDVKSVVFEFPG